MKGLKAAALLAPAAVAAVPSPWMQEVQEILNAVAPNSLLARLGLWNADRLYDLAGDASQTVEHVLTAGVREFKTWKEHGREFMQRGNNLSRVAPAVAALEEYQLRVTLTEQGELASPKICDSVKQRSGYLDISDSKHLFFWFFEARNDPENAPLLIWLNGGPGCSSSTGLLMELGPCQVAEHGDPVKNPFSWNTNMNMIFIDQPVDVGFSYRTGGSGVNNSPAAAEDIWAFVQLFISRFPEYEDREIHLAAESYGGHYAPNIAAAIHKHNEELRLAKAPTPLKRINLASVILANGLTEPRTQMGSVPDYACKGPFPVFDPQSRECSNLYSKAATCQRLIQSCYNGGSRFSCLYGDFQNLGLNPYDVRRKCDRNGEDGQLCYKIMDHIDEFLNREDVKKELGAEGDIKFQSCNMEVNQAFMFQGDGMHNSAALLPTLLDAGIRLMVYAGNADFMCNFMGNERWLDTLEGHQYADKFRVAKSKPWHTLDSGKLVGRTRSVAGNITYVEVFDAGHMVPYDQPEAALDMIERWVFQLPLDD
ncbi:Alpha/Beta hydrolase protein [Auriculariales sp. MPI-PUGE-AT-0066]|nr:Alpha/Beta hydrolase protein [Auriculariales sp. MPI-PUGE-AT-0066]